MQTTPQAVASKGIEAFRAKLNDDLELQAAMRSAMSKDLQAVLALGRQHGFDFTAEQLDAASRASDLSDFELELVSGGTTFGGGVELINSWRQQKGG